MAELKYYQIINKKTGAVVGRATTLKGARRSVDNNDNKYGGYVHTFKPIYMQEESKAKYNNLNNPFIKARKPMQG